MKLSKYRLLLLAALLYIGVASVSAQEIQPRIAGLEANVDYMNSLAEDAKLQSLETSVINSVEQMRKSLRENPTDRQRLSQEILQLEGRIFEIRTARGKLVDRINSIEQEWVFSNLNNPTNPSAKVSATQDVTDLIPDSLKVRNLVDNFYFRQNLSPDDYLALKRAQQLELGAVDLVNRYFENHTPIMELGAAYASTQIEAEANEIHSRLNALQGINRTLADSLSEVWNYVFDNKSYSYSFVLEQLGRDDMLSREEERLSEASRQLAALSGQTASDIILDYLLRKSVSIEFELSVAQALGLTAAQDSLRGVLTQVKAIDYKLPKVEVQQRYFLDFDSLRFTAPSVYTAQNPIPEVRIFPQGVIYRVQVGTFSAKRPVSVFRGTSPLSYSVDEQGKWRYFAGGFATREQAQAAQKLLKTKGFVRPEIAVWNDGVYHNLAQDADAMAMLYRVEIENVESLSDGVRSAISAASNGRELSRVGTHIFVIGMFDDRALAEKLADAIRAVDGALEIKVAEIAQ